MLAPTVHPGVVNSARLDEVPDPPVAAGSVVVRTRAIGVCGTDIEITSGQYGWAPPGCERLVLGHESLGEVEHGWLTRLISRRVPIERWQEAMHRQPDDAKVVIAW